MERRFFHWELEFPEVFFGRDGRGLGEAAGFDAVVGNPPYISVTNIEKADRRIPARCLRSRDRQVRRLHSVPREGAAADGEGGTLRVHRPIKFAIYANGLPLREMLLDRTRIRDL